MRLRDALTSRTVRGWWLAAALVCGVQVAHAGYAQAVPPAGFSRVGDAWTYRAANASEWLGSTVRTNATLNVAGRSVTLPAALRMAANAPRFAAASMFSPVGVALAAAAVLAPIAADLWSEHQIKWNPDTGRWERTDPAGPPQYNLYCVEGIYGGCQTPDFSSIDAAIAARKPQWDGPTGLVRCDAALGTYPKVYSVNCQIAELYTSENPPIPSNFNGLHIGNIRGHGGEIASPPPAVSPVSASEFETLAHPYIDPEDVPELVPGKAIPVELPIINPSADPVPVPRPLRVPLGDPVANPQPSGSPVPAPYPWRQPVADITASPTQAEPWRVNVDPKDILLPTPDGIDEPTTLPAPDPGADPNAPPANEAPSEPGLCALYPDILACARPELDTPEQEIPKQDREITYTELALFGSGSCPADKTSSVGGQVVTVWEWGPKCDLISTYVRPVFIAAAAFAALLILTPSRGES